MEKIVEIGIKFYNEDSKQKVRLIKDNEDANNLLNDLEYNPHVFVLGCLMNRQIDVAKAWIIPDKVFKIVKTHNVDELSKIDKSEYHKIFEDNKFHRFNKDMAEIFYDGVQRIMQEYDGDASKIWKDKPSSALVVYRFLEFNGCGIKIATMAANILARRYKVEFSDYYSIDISPDTHVMRVMKRMGYVHSNANREMVIYKARELHPEFPGIIDYSFWKIGREYCNPSNPDCDNCIVKNQCKKMIS